MAAVVPSVDQAAALLQNLSLDSQTKTKANVDLSDPAKKTQPPSTQLDPKDVSSGYAPPSDRSVTPFLPDAMDPSLFYPQNGYPHAHYYYAGYDGAGNDWDEYNRYAHQEAGVEIPAGVYGDNVSLMYHHGYGYAPYAPFSPAGSTVPAVAHDSQVYGHQQYQYPSHFFPMSPSTGTYTPTPASNPQGEFSSGVADMSPLSVETANGNAKSFSDSGGKGTSGSAMTCPSYQNSSFLTNNSYSQGGFPNSGYQDPRFGVDGISSPTPWLDGPVFSDGQPRPVINNSFSSSVSHGANVPVSRNQSLHPHANALGLHQPRPFSGLGTVHGFMNRVYPGKFYGQYANVIRSSFGYGSSSYDARTNGRGWFAGDSKDRNRVRSNAWFNYGNENMDGMNELNKGPRARSSKNQNMFAPTSLVVKGQPDAPKSNHDDVHVVLDREKYNRPDFPETYVDAKFFVIKSYSEDDVHKSIKYNVWSSTPNGNKKLDAAYKEAQEKTGPCPVFILFSVNTSGQFVGLAEMVGPVDFLKNVEYWQQDKWNGSFPVKWHIVKDVPNNLLKHITLENNENKPVTNSRDTQEVKLEQGLQMLKIFKDHVSKTCILEDFQFYDGRQKAIQEKKAKQQLQKQVWEGKNTVEKNKDGANGDLKLLKSVDVPDSAKETPLADTVVFAMNGDTPKSPKVAVSDSHALNGAANGC